MKLLLLLPILGSVIISVLPTETLSDRVRLKQIALITSFLTLLQAIKL